MRMLHRLPLIFAAAIGGCSQGGDTDSGNLVPASNEVTQAVLPTPEPPLDREALLIAVVRAASAAAAGLDDAKAQRALDGKPFAIALRLGCARSEPGGQGSVEERGSADNRSIVLRSRPGVRIDDPLLAGGTASDEVEAVEGFWVERPWLLTAACPPTPPQPTGAEDMEGQATQAEAASQRRVAIAQFFTAEDTRAGRRTDRPFEAVLKPDEGRAIVESGFNLVLAGRLRAMPGGKVIRCKVAGPSRPPDCLISAQFDQVRMEHPVTGAVLAQWAD